MPKSAAPDMSVDDLFFVFIDNITGRQIEEAVKKGSLFRYDWRESTPGSNDKKMLKEFRTCLLAHLHKRAECLFKKTMIMKGFAKSEAAKEVNLHKKESIRVQAANYLRYFTDIRNGKRSITTGSETESWMLVLYEAMVNVDQEQIARMAEENAKADDLDDKHVLSPTPSPKQSPKRSNPTSPTTALASMPLQMLSTDASPVKQTQHRLLRMLDSTPSPTEKGCVFVITEEGADRYVCGASGWDRIILQPCRGRSVPDDSGRRIEIVR